MPAIFDPGIISTNSGTITIYSSNTATCVHEQWFIQAHATTSAMAAWAQWTSQTISEIQGQQAAEARCAANQLQAARAQDQARQAYEAHMREAGLAQKRARALLVQHLSPEQRKTYEERGYFDVDVNGKTYRIRQGTHGNVRLLQPLPPGASELITPAEKISFCAQPAGVPAEDAMLAQKLMLETEERKFLEIANWTDMTTGRLMDKRLALQEMR